MCAKKITYADGFTIGVLIGGFLDFATEGIIVIKNVLPDQILGVFRVVWLLSLVMTLYRAYKRRSLFSPPVDGLIQGFLIGAAIISVYLGKFPFT